MSIVKRDRRIDSYQLQLITDVIHQIANSQMRPNYIADVLRARSKGSNVITITNGVHYNQYDSSGHYHFDLQITHPNVNPLQIFHVYVIPNINCNEQPIRVTDDTSAVLTQVPCYWQWTFVAMT
jgi:hypothetical protein